MMPETPLSLQNKGSDKKSRNKQCTHNNNQGLNPTQNTSDKRKLATLRLAPLELDNSYSHEFWTVQITPRETKRTLAQTNP
jgi:hypothetical protein